MLHQHGLEAARLSTGEDVFSGYSGLVKEPKLILI